MAKILIVDDNEQNLYMLRIVLKSRNYEVEEAKNGAEALEKARIHPPDMIVSDILMPVMDGFTLCRNCKEDEKLKDIPFVFYTATYTDPKDEKLALSLGADRFVVKPVEPNGLAEIIDEVFDERRKGNRPKLEKPIGEETVYFKQYNEALVRKLEQKMISLERANRQLESLYNSSLVLTSIIDLSLLLPQILGIVIKTMRYDSALLHLYDDNTKSFPLVKSIGISENIVEIMKQCEFKLEDEHCLISLVAKNTQPLIINDTSKDERWINYSVPISSALLIPIIYQQETLGVMVLGSEEVNKFKEEDAQSSMILANGIAVAIKNAKLYEQAQQEINKRREAEEQLKLIIEEKEMLLRELYHRTRNNMQVIISMFSLKSKYIKNKEVIQTFDEMKNRIQSMALVHHKLYQSKNLSRINLKDYIIELSNLLLSSFSFAPNKVSFKFELEDVFVLIDVAIPCGLILNELITNALKHAFPKDLTGEIVIRLYKFDETINLEVSDNGIGVPKDFNFKENSNLGLRLVFGLVETQLNGNIKIESNNGVLCHVKFKNVLYKGRV